MSKNNEKPMVIKIVNEKRKRRINEFIDKDHEVMSEFYEVLDRDISAKQVLKEMRRLVEVDPDFYDPYITASDILFSMGKKEEAAALLQNAYYRALLTIVDSKGRWPKIMYWGFLENRHVMRALEKQALYYWEIGKIDEALDIFRQLLRVNPNDNQGVRYNILAIKMGLSFDTWEETFEVEEDGQIVGLNAFKISSWFKENAPKYDDEFQWLLDLYRTWDEGLQEKE